MKNRYQARSPPKYNMIQFITYPSQTRCARPVGSRDHRSHKPACPASQRARKQCQRFAGPNDLRFLTRGRLEGDGHVASRSCELLNRMRGGSRPQSYPVRSKGR